MAVAVLLVASLAPARALAGYTLYESASFSQPGEPYGYSLSEVQYLGVRFQNVSPWRVEFVGGHMFQGEGVNNRLFAALVQLDGPDDMPTDADLLLPRWSTTFEAPYLSADLLIEANVTLDPGWWGLIYGSGGALGSTGSGGMAAYQPNIGYPSFFRRRDGNWEESATRGKRFVVFGTVACYEDTGDTEVQCNEDCYDQLDNDEDGFVDCQDEDCWHLVDCCDADLDGFLRHEELCGWGPDCDDTMLTGPAVYPGAGELPNDGVDQDCDGVETCFRDADLDGFGHATWTVLSTDMACGNEPGEATETTDCDDEGPLAPTIYPGAIELIGDGVDQDCDGHDRCFVDRDGDGFGTLPAIDVDGIDCDLVPGASSTGGDCDDDGPLASRHYPGATEVIADGIDQDCDGADACYLDADGDGFGTPVGVAATGSCDAAPFASSRDDDCDDRPVSGARIYPGAFEVPGDRVDQDCDGVDTCYVDSDGDGYGTADQAPGLGLICEASFGLSRWSSDCVDLGPGAASIYPGAPEVPGDGVDQNCDGDDDCYFDRDHDGVGGTIVARGVSGVCDALLGYSSRSDDCRDVGVGAPFIYPGAPEVVADGVDQDCDLQDACWADEDLDGFGGEQTVPGGDLRCDDDPGESGLPGDCADFDPAVYPGASELVADGVDSNCDGQELCYLDLDLDRYGTDELVLSSVVNCASSHVGAPRPGDCDDDDQSVHPGAWEVPYDGLDQDCDGVDLVDVDGDGQLWVGALGEDCQDNDRTVFRGATERPNGVDDDCDGLVDEGTTLADDDGDGFSEIGGDCDDSNPAVRPGAVELCNGISDDCDRLVDEGTACFDDDYDGFTELVGDCHDADARVFPGAVEIPGNGLDDNCDGLMVGELRDDDGDGFTELGGDCAPLQPSVHPGAPEVADGLDNNCDGRIDEGTVHYDDDGDGLAEDEGDCHDADAAVHPGAVEVLNGVDDDCDDRTDNVGRWADLDGDRYVGDMDCDDTNATVYVLAPERADGVDNDCDGQVDEGLEDLDGDGWTTADGDCNDRHGWARPDAVELCDAIDNDCNGLVDEGCDGGFDAVGLPVRAGCAVAGGGAEGALVGLVCLGLRRRRFESRLLSPQRRVIG